MRCSAPSPLLVVSAEQKSVQVQLPMMETYEDYLDKLVSPIDLLMLQDRKFARQLVELGYRGSGAILDEEDFSRQRAETKAR